MSLSPSPSDKGAVPSILELLTEENPTVNYGIPKSRTKTAHPSNVAPKQIRPWEKFNIDTLRDLFKGSLWVAAQKEVPAFKGYPDIDPTWDCDVTDEKTAIHLLTKWNHTIVQKAAGALQPHFNACGWVAYPGLRRKLPELETPPEGYQWTPEPPTPSTATAPENDANETKDSQRQKFPDAGSLVKCRQHSPGPCPSNEVERMPKEYKTSTKWKSADVLEDGDIIHPDTGMVLDPKSADIRPIKQAFTYCLEWGCRYGCILSTFEAFIFRIKPRDRSNPSLDMSLRNNGLLEFVSVPWEANGSNVLTYNLALWAMHVLAGNDSGLDWEYRELNEEQLVDEDCQKYPLPMTPTSSSTQRQRTPNSKKRSASSLEDKHCKARKLMTEDAVDSSPSGHVASRKRRATRRGPERQPMVSEFMGSFGLSGMNIKEGNQDAEEGNV